MSTGWLLLIAGTCALAGLGCARFARRAWLFSAVLGNTVLLAAAVAVLTTGGTWEWRPDFFLGGERIHLRLDAVSALFLALLAAIGGVGSVYANGYWTDRHHPRSAPAGRWWWSILLGCLALVLLASNGLHFLIAWEIFTIAAYFLITLERTRRDVRAAGWLYLAASHVSMMCLFAFFALLAARTGGWDLGPMRERGDLAPLFWLALAGFGLKAGMYPLHVWLPSAHANAPSHVSAILSGVTIKLGIYGIVRFSGWLPVPPTAGWAVAALGVISAVLGVVFALGQHDLKRLLAYHSVENIGIILIGLGFAMIAAAQGDASGLGAPAWGRLALAGSLLHVWNHGLFKSLLFFGAGSVLSATGTREMSRLGGLWRAMPWTTVCFVVGAAAIAGLPPLNGFVSEWLVFLGLFDSLGAGGPAAWAAGAAAILLGVTGALALACFVKVCGVVFLGQPRTDAARRATECGPSMRFPMLLLAGACAAIGLAPVLFWPAIATAANAWRPGLNVGAIPPAPLAALGSFHVALAAFGTLAVVLLWRRLRQGGIARTVTWDCGYASPTARMQYTAGSFAEIITGWFRWILRPERHRDAPLGNFPVRAGDATHTPETVLDHFVAPVGGGLLRIASAVRRSQHGRLQFYILYLVAGLAGLALIALTGATR